jgi:hypothetical protein
MSANEHYVSQVLLRRFTENGHLHHFHLPTGKWRRLSPKKVFSGFGYNQLQVFGQVDHTLEQAFSKVESPLPITFAALEKAADNPTTELTADIYENLCWYCAFLWRVSPFAKMAAPVEFVVQLNMDLENNRLDTLREVLGYPERICQFYRCQRAMGYKVIINSQNFLQLIYRIQFRLKYGDDYTKFRYFTKWTICRSPIDLPIADVALTQIPVNTEKVVVYGLPISPRLLLKGQMAMGEQPSSLATTVKGATMSQAEAEIWYEALCLSAVNELVSKRAIPDVLEVRARARSNGIAFTKITDPDAIIAAGQFNFSGNFGLAVVPPEVYVKFIHSFLRPADKPTSKAAVC